MGDINVHLDMKEETNMLKFNRLLERNGLVQHVIGPIQHEDHTLDVLITHTDVTPTATLVEELSLSDHSFMLADMALQVNRDQPVISVVECRSWHNFDIDSFSATLLHTSVERSWKSGSRRSTHQSSYWMTHMQNWMVTYANLACAQTSNAHRNCQGHRPVSSETLLLGSDTILAGKTTRFISGTDYCKHV